MKITDNTEISGGIIWNGSFYPKKNLASGTIRLVLSSKCNFKCKFCFAEGEDKKDRTLDIDYIKKILKISKEFGIKNVKLTGGEPLLYPNLEELLRFIKDEDFKYLDITTNVSLLDDKMIDLLNQYSVYALTLSLSAFDANKYAKITGFKGFEKIIKNITNAKNKFNGNLRINSVVFDEGFNLDEYKNIIKFCIENSLGLRIVEPTTVKNLDITYNHTAFNEVKTYLKNTYKFLKSQCESVEYYFYDKQKYITVMKSLCDNKLCNVCRDYMYIRLSSDGKLKPCLSRKDTEIDIPLNASENLIRNAFIMAIHNVGNGLPDHPFDGLNNPYTSS